MQQIFHNPLIALHELSLSLLSESNTERLLEMILSQAVEVTKADSGSISLLDDKREFLEIKAFKGIDPLVAKELKLKIGEGVTGRCILTGRTKNIGDIRKDAHYVQVRSDILSELAVPLKVGGKSFGVVSVDSSSLDAFINSHEEYLEILSGYAAQIITNQQTLENMKHRTYIQELLLKVSSHIGYYPKFEVTFHKTIEFLQEKITLDRAGIYAYDKARNELCIVAAYNYTEQEKLKSYYSPAEGTTGKVFSSKKAIAISDINEDKKFLNKSGKIRNRKRISFFASPIILDGECKAVFSMEIPYQSQSSFEDYTFLVQILSSLFSQSMQIQNLIEKTTNDIRYENIFLKRQLHKNYSFANIIGRSDQMMNLFKKMHMVADSNSSVLIVGESGTGKELIASALHQNSIRRNNALVKINCAAIPSELLESELFGYAKGAFTGAEEEKKGKFLIAHKGTIFLDEIGEMDYQLQSKILRILQEREFSPLGSNRVFKVDVRIITATNASLEKLIQQKKFREDLYYRLNVIRLEIPPLRERKNDLPILVQHLIKRISRQNGKKIKSISKEALQRLERYHFPGNVRELENILERAIVLGQREKIQLDDLQIPKEENKTDQNDSSQDNSMVINGNIPILNNADIPDRNLSSVMDEILSTSTSGNYYRDMLKSFEFTLIKKVLKKNFYQKSKTAAALGLNRITLNNKINQYRLMKDEL